MGLDIGYYLYKKQPVDERNEYIQREGFEPAWVCGRNEICDAWGELFYYSLNKEITPVFQQGLAGKKRVYGEFSEEFKLVKFEDFKSIVQNAIDEAFESGRKEKKDLAASISRNKEKQKELRDLQKTCTENEAYAFEQWGREIKELDEEIDELQERLNSYDNTDYFWNKAEEVQNLLNEMEQKLKEDEYYVVPYFSY